MLLVIVQIIIEWLSRIGELRQGCGPRGEFGSLISHLNDIIGTLVAQTLSLAILVNTSAGRESLELSDSIVVERGL